MVGIISIYLTDLKMYHSMFDNFLSNSLSMKSDDTECCTLVAFLLLTLYELSGNYWSDSLQFIVSDVNIFQDDKFNYIIMWSV